MSRQSQTSGPFSPREKVRMRGNFKSRLMIKDLTQKHPQPF